MDFAPRQNFTKTQIAMACRVLGGQLGPLPAGVEGPQLLWAMAGVESSFGADCQPRHEPAYDVGGAYARHAPMPVLLSRFGSAAACSYGPLQLLLVNAPLQMAPENFDNLAYGMQQSITYLNSLLRHWRPGSLDEIGECWNAGHITPDPAYTEKLAATYQTPMPPAPNPLAAAA